MPKHVYTITTDKGEYDVEFNTPTHDVTESRKQLAAANAKPVHDSSGRTLLEDFATAGPMGHMNEAMGAAGRGEYAKAGHEAITGAGQVLAPAALPAIAAAPGAALIAAIAGAAGTAIARVGAQRAGATPDQADLAGDVGGIVAGGVGGKYIAPGVGRLGAMMESAGSNMTSTEARAAAGVVGVPHGGVVPGALRVGGRILQKVGRYVPPNPTGARTIDMPGNARSIRVSPPRGAATPRVPISGEPGAIEAPAVNPETGARTIDVDASGLPVDATPPPRGSGYRTAVPGSSTGPAPYRAAAKAAVRADAKAADEAAAAEENARKLAEIERRKVGLVAQPPTVSDSLSAVAEDGTRSTSSIRFTPPKKAAGAVGEAADDLESQIFEVAGQKVRPGTPAHAKIVESLRRQERAVDAAGRDLGTMEPPIAEKPTSGPQGVPAQATGPEATDRAAAAAAANPRQPAPTPTEGTVRTSPPPKESGKIPGVKNPSKGATDEEIIALRTKHGAEEAGTILANDPRFKGMPKTQRTNAIRTLAGDEAGLLPTSAQKDIDAKLGKMGSKEAAEYLAKAPNATAYNYISKRMKLLGLLVDEE